MVESSNSSELLAKLQSEKDWHKSAVFTDKGDIITTNKCTLLPDEIKYDRFELKTLSYLYL
jgi:hypothetical protein